LDLFAPSKVDALAIAVPATLNPQTAVSRQLAILHSSSSVADSMTWVGMGSDKITISTTPLPAPSMKASVPDHQSLYEILRSARHSISIDPSMAVKAQSGAAASALRLLR
jgi:hypothetical protein